MRGLTLVALLGILLVGSVAYADTVVSGVYQVNATQGFRLTNGSLMSLFVNTTSGSVGIGTTAPEKELTVNGSMSSIASAPRLISTITDAVFLNYTSGVAVSGKYAFVSDGFGHGITAINIADPRNPKIVGTIKNTTYLYGAYNIQIVGKYAYTSSFPSVDSFGITDISDPSNMTIVGGISGCCQMINGPAGLHVIGKYAYVGNAGGGIFLGVIDISNPSNPRLISRSTAVGGNNLFNFQVRGKYAFASIPIGDKGNLTIFDISDPYKPTVIEKPDDNIIGRIYVDGPYVYTTIFGGTYDFIIINATNVTDLKIIGRLNNTEGLRSGYPLDIYVSGKYAYLTSPSNKTFSIIDVSDPTNPRLASYTFLPLKPERFTVSGKYAYITTSSFNDSMMIVELPGLDSPTAKIGDIETASIKITGKADVDTDLYVRGGISAGNSIKSDGAIAAATNLTVASLNTTNCDMKADENGTFYCGTDSMGVGWTTTATTVYNDTADVKVGIGTPTPTQKLDVNGSVNINGNISMPTSFFIGNSAQSTGSYGVSIGYYAGANAVGSNNAYTGYYAGYQSTGSNNAFYGIYAGYLANGSNNAFYGGNAGQQSTGDSNAYTGVNAGYLSTGSFNAYTGYSAGVQSTGSYNAFYGQSAGQNANGSNNAFYGGNAGQQSTGDNNVFSGRSAGQQSVGSINAYTGYSAGYQSNGNRTIGIGYEALKSNGANDVVALGYQAGYQNTASNQFIVRQANINPTPLIQGNFSSGYVGIGTTSPNARLEVNGTGASNIFYAYEPSTAMGLRVNSAGRTVIGTTGLDTVIDLDIRHSQNAETGAYIINDDQGSAATSTILLGSEYFGSKYGWFSHYGTNYSTSGLLVANGTAIGSADTGGLAIIAYSPDAPMIFATGGLASSNERMRITSSGNVGIGTTNPSALLEINGANPADNLSLNVNNTLYVNASTRTVGIGTSRPMINLDIRDSRNAEVGVFAVNPNTGTSAASSFTVGQAVSGSKYGYLMHGGLNFAGAGLVIANRTALIGADVGGLVIGAINANGNILFAAGSSSDERMRIDSFGNVGIGTATPAEKLNINGSLRVDNSSGSSIFMVNASSGNVGIGMTSPQRALHISDVMRLEPRASAPTSPASGDIYVDSTPNPDELCFYDGSAWQALASGTDANCV